jgi:CotH kinase protein/Lamin Tail Domain/Chitobiase/beta-hexosaminidase C-terminal domain/GEVED domain/Divergent InlB B-repeat domain
MSLLLYLRLLFFGFFLIVCNTSSSQNLLINEFVASNSTGATDEVGDHDDWVELYNADSIAINLAGWYVSDNQNNLKLHKISNADSSKTTIEAGGYLILWFDNEASEGVLHCKPKLSANGEAIFLTAPNGTNIVDSRVFQAQFTDVSEGRRPNGGEFWDFYQIPTPNAANSTPIGSPWVAPVLVSKKGGKYDTTFSIVLSCATPNAQIRYTLNGQTPTDSSNLYLDSLQILATTVLRVKAFLPPMQSSKVLTESYFIGVNHTFPVVSLVFDSLDFFDENTGIYPNYTQDIATKTNVEFFENELIESVFNQLVEVEVQGVSSALVPQKSLALKAKSAYGKDNFSYPIFPDLPYEKYKNLVLRNGGQDWNVLMFRDEFVGSLANDLGDLGDLLQKPVLNMQAARPSVVYYNGQYWGIHNLRERMNQAYVEQHFNLPSGSYDLIENFRDVMHGDSLEWAAFYDFFSNTQFEETENLNEMKQKIDYQNFLDYCIFNIYIDNQDWPGNNVRRFREKAPQGKWRWLSFDFDYTFGLYQPGAWNTGDAAPNALARILNGNNQLWPNPDWATLLFRKCWENASFRQDFANRSADFMNTIFAPDRIAARLSQFQLLYQPEIAQHYDRWTSGFWAPYWEENIAKTRNFAEKRPDYMRSHLDEALIDVTGSTTFTLSAAPLFGGKIHISTIQLNKENYPWTGTYFSGVKIPVKAIPAEGFVFIGWSEEALGKADSVLVTLSDAKNLVAYFQDINDLIDSSYCLPSSDSSVNCYIKTVKIDAFIKESGEGSYTQNNNIPIQIEPEKEYPISLISKSATEDNYWRVWIDLNKNDVFESTEVVFEQNAAINSNEIGTQIAEGLFEIPLTFYGFTSMRIALKQGSFPNACDRISSGEFEDYILEIIEHPFEPCLINATASNFICNNNNTNDVLEDDNYTFDLLVSGAAMGWDLEVASAYFYGEQGSKTTIGPLKIADGNQQITVSNIGNPDCTTTLNIFAPDACSIPNVPENCVMQGNFPWHDWISGVNIGELRHNSSKSQYSNFRDFTVFAEKNTRIPIQLSAGFSYETFNEYFRVWVDWNQDGDLEDAGEMVYQRLLLRPYNGIAIASFNDVFKIPLTALKGATLLRVAMSRDAYPENCISIDFGEVEDYTIVVLEPNEFLVKKEHDLPIIEGDLQQETGYEPNLAVQYANILTDYLVFPNPTNKEASINLKSMLGQEINLTLFNVLGKPIKTFYCQKLTEPLFDLSFLNVPKGQYYLKIPIDKGGKVIFKPISVMNNF